MEAARSGHASKSAFTVAYALIRFARVTIPTPSNPLALNVTVYASGRTRRRIQLGPAQRRAIHTVRCIRSRGRRRRLRRNR
jgi:hypothetical protein